MVNKREKARKLRILLGTWQRRCYIIKETMQKWGHDDDRDGTRSDDDNGSGQPPGASH